MTLLRCCVQDCINNKSNYCSLGQISIGGASTYQADGTSCKSFLNKDKALSSYITDGNPYIEICCSAKHCIHNKDLKCAAPSVDIAGYTSETIEETQCTSFMYK